MVYGVGVFFDYFNLENLIRPKFLLSSDESTDFLKDIYENKIEWGKISFEENNQILLHLCELRMYGRRF